MAAFSTRRSSGQRDQPVLPLVDLGVRGEEISTAVVLVCLCASVWI